MADGLPVNSYVPVGTYTELQLLQPPSDAQLQSEAAAAVDLAGMLESAQVKTRELIGLLNIILRNLPAGNAMGPVMQTLIADLS
jgi:hypothetical protein